MELLIKLQKFQEVRHRTVNKQLKVNKKKQGLTEKYQKKDIYLQKKGSKLLMI